MTGIAETSTPTVWLDLPGAPGIPGLRFRAFRDLADYEPMAAVMGVAARADGIPWLPSAESLRIENEGDDGISPPDDIVFAEIDGIAVAVAGSDRVVRDDVPTYEIWGAVDPPLAGGGSARPCSPGTSPECTNVRRPSTRGCRSSSARTRMMPRSATGSSSSRTASSPSELLPDASRPDSAPIPDLPLPDGIELRAVNPDQHRAIYDAQTEAFRDHWGHREGSEHGFVVTYARKELDTSLWAVAWAGDEIAGVVENWIWADENASLGVERGWLEKVSVRRPFRRKGLARALVGRIAPAVP